MVNIKSLLFSLAGLVIPMISAYDNSPLLFFDNEWAMFSIFFILFVAIIYSAVNKTTSNKAVSAAISISLSLLISVSLGKKDLLSGYFSDSIINWLIVASIIIGGFFMFKLFINKFGAIKGTIYGIITLGFVSFFAGLLEIIPEEIRYGTLESFFDFFESSYILIIWAFIFWIAFIIFRYFIRGSLRRRQIKLDAKAAKKGEAEIQKVEVRRVSR